MFPPLCVLDILDDLLFFFLMIRRPPRSTLDRSSAASDVYKRQDQRVLLDRRAFRRIGADHKSGSHRWIGTCLGVGPVSYTHLRAHETVLDIVCRLLLEKKKKNDCTTTYAKTTPTKHIHHRVCAIAQHRTIRSTRQIK